LHSGPIRRGPDAAVAQRVLRGGPISIYTQKRDRSDRLVLSLHSHSSASRARPRPRLSREPVIIDYQRTVSHSARAMASLPIPVVGALLDVVVGALLDVHRQVAYIGIGVVLRSTCEITNIRL